MDKRFPYQSSKLALINTKYAIKSSPSLSISIRLPTEGIDLNSLACHHVLAANYGKLLFMNVMTFCAWKPAYNFMFKKKRVGCLLSNALQRIKMCAHLTTE